MDNSSGSPLKFKVDDMSTSIPKDIRGSFVFLNVGGKIDEEVNSSPRKIDEILKDIEDIDIGN